MNSISRNDLIGIIITLLALGLVTAGSPAERTLGANVRVVYLHGAWVWASLAAFVAAGVAGLAGLVSRRAALHRWSRALGRTGLFFWITYLPLSMWAMQANWNGLFLAEPRWRLAVIFAVGGVVLQLGGALTGDAVWVSGANIVYVSVLALALVNIQNVMHPPAPILNSNATRIRAYFMGLLLITLLLAGLLARVWYKLESSPVRSGD